MGTETRKKLHKELVEAVALDEYFFHQRPDIWQNFLAKTAKKHFAHL